MKEQLIYSIEKQLKETQQHDYIYVRQDYDEALDEHYDEFYLVSKEKSGIVTEVFLWEDGEAYMQQWMLSSDGKASYSNQYDFATVEAFARYWAVFSTGLTR